MNSERSLFISLGTSPAIVPEAFLLPETEFTAVHVLTTEVPDVSFVQTFFKDHAPDTRLNISRVAGFTDFTSEEGHFGFEEVMYRWILETQTRPDDRYICLAGGFKTMSAAMQKAAAVLGAAQVLHVIAENCCTDANGKRRSPETIEEIFAAKKNSQLHWIRLGPESGWPQLRTARPKDYPLTVTRTEGNVRWVTASDGRFRQHLREIVERSHLIAGTWEQLPTLPFAELAAWPEADLNWLHQPLVPQAQPDRQWIAALPKLELHCHLGGFATHGELLQRVRNSAEHPNHLPKPKPPELPRGWPLPEHPINLSDYMRLGDANGTPLLKDPGCLRRQCQLLYEHFIEQNILYAEVRCSPANYATSNRSPWTVLNDIRETFQQCMKKAQLAKTETAVCHVNLILIATRRSEGDYRATISRHLALAVAAAEHWTDEDSCRVVGVDLAGYEDVTTRAHYFREEFTGIHRCGLALTVHAGENDDAEGIWRAVFDLNARRLGHALSLAQSPELLRSITDRGIGLEMCPYANYQIGSFLLDPADQVDHPDNPPRQPLPYPLLDYLNAGARVTVNTDNIGISSATLTDNLLLAARLCPKLTRLDVLRMHRHALDSAFCSANQRVTLLRRFSQFIPKP